jgi:hypothetical protein
LPVNKLLTKYDGEGLQHDVVAVAILMHERGADVEPEVVLAFAFDDGVRLVARLLVGHGQLLRGWYGAPYDPDEIGEQQIVATLKRIANTSRP